MVRLNRIYTRTGDDGSTGLVDGSRVGKDSARMAAIGSVDEANSAIGLALAAAADAAWMRDVRRVQNDLFDLGADLATPATQDDDFAPSDMVLRITPAQVAWIEAAIDALNDDLDPLKSFILPGGTDVAARIQVARAITRRAERDMVTLMRSDAVNPHALAYVNRLSDYLFVLARWIMKDSGGDILWVPGASR